MVSAAGAISIALIGLFSMELLSLELVLAISFLPLVAWVFFHHQEFLLLAVITAYFGTAYLSTTLVASGLVRGTLLLAIGLVLLLRLAVKGAVARVSTPVDRIILFWCLIIVSSLVQGFYFRHNEPQYLVGDLYKFLEILLIFYLTTFLVKEDRQARFLIWGFFVVAIAFGAVDSMTFLSRFYLVGSALLARVRAAAQFSSLFALILAISLFLHERRMVVRGTLAILGLGFLISFILTFLRTGYIALPPALVFVLVLYLYKHKRHAFARTMRFAVLSFSLLALVLCVNLILSTIGPDIDIIQASLARLRSLVDPASSDPMGVRILELRSITSQVLIPSPFLGNGLGGEYFSATLVEEELEWGMKHYVHNNYFDFIVRTGILGLIAFLVLAVRFLKDAVTFYLRSEQSFYQGILLGSLGVFVCSCIIALSTSIFYSPFLFMMMAVTYCVAHIEEKKRKRRTEKRLSR